MDDATRLGGKLEDVVPQHAVSGKTIETHALDRIAELEDALRLIETLALLQLSMPIPTTNLMGIIEHKCKEVLGGGKPD